MPTDATGTPTTLGIPTYNTAVDAPSGLGFNATMAVIDTLLQGRIANTLVTTSGDMIYASAANTPARLPLGSAGQILVVLAGKPQWVTPASLNYLNSVGLSTASVTAVMCGMGGVGKAQITPAFSGRLDIAVTYTVSAGATVSSSESVYLMYGTGTAPAANAALTGTQIDPGQLATYYGDSSGQFITISVVGQLTGLTVGTTYWFDLGIASSSGTVALNNAAFTSHEF